VCQEAAALNESSCDRRRPALAARRGALQTLDGDASVPACLPQNVHLTQTVKSILRGRYLMVSCCVNPQCAMQSKLFGAGALYALEMKIKTVRSSHRKQYVWLCASCAAGWTLQTNSVGNVVVTTRSKVPSFTRTHASGGLRLVFRSTGVPLPTTSNCWKQGG
jgi:hypothetical protein